MVSEYDGAVVAGLFVERVRALVASRDAAAEDKHAKRAATSTESAKDSVAASMPRSAAEIKAEFRAETEKIVTSEANLPLQAPRGRSGGGGGGHLALSA